MRSGENRPLESAFGPPDATASAQPLPHNPRKQRKNPAAAGSRERFRWGKWRRRRDSNPRDGFPPTHFPGARLRPLGHISADHIVPQWRGVQDDSRKNLVSEETVKLVILRISDPDLVYLRVLSLSLSGDFSRVVCVLEVPFCCCV